MDKPDAEKVRQARRMLFFYGFLDKVGDVVDYKWKFYQKDKERCQKIILDSVIINEDAPRTAVKSNGFTMDDLCELFKRRKDRDSKRQC